MNASVAGQFSSNMLRRLFVLCFLAFGGLVADGEPVSRYARSRDSSSVDCVGDGDNSAVCEPVVADRDPLDVVPARFGRARMLETALNGDISRESYATGRKGKGDKGYGRYLWYIIAATKATWLYITTHAVAAIAGKALIVAKVALAVASAIALKKLFEHNDKISYEIVKHPHHSFVQTHSTSVDYDHHGGFDESSYGSRRKRRRILR